MMQVLKYQTASATFLEQAFEEIESGDLRQASEKGWGAAVEIVKAIAQHRGWEHGSHDSLFEVASRLAQEVGDYNISYDFSGASTLHTNFYEGWLREEMVRNGLDQVRRLVGTLSPLLQPTG